MHAPASASDTLEVRFTRVLGRSPTPAEVAEWHRWREALELRNSDSFWCLVFLTQQQRASLSAVPGEVQRAVREVRGPLSEELGELAGATIDGFEKALEGSVRAIARDVIREARKLADARAAGTRLQWLAGAVALCVVAIAAAVSGGYWLGVRGADADARTALVSCEGQGMQRIARDGAEWCAVRVR